MNDLISGQTDRKRCCCNCRHNIRTGEGFASCHCEIDGHYIGYVACFDDWCRRWASDRDKWEVNKTTPEPYKGE